jgi:beta-lactamase regulating signal transducer with metallopeptidase domain
LLWSSAGDAIGVELGTSLFLIAVGAILTFAINATVSGIDIATVGIILMIIGVVGLLISLLYLAPRRRAVVSERPVVRDREYY